MNITVAWDGRISPPGFNHLSLANITLGSILCTKTIGIRDHAQLRGIYNSNVCPWFWLLSKQDLLRNVSGDGYAVTRHQHKLTEFIACKFMKLQNTWTDIFTTECGKPANAPRTVDYSPSILKLSHQLFHQSQCPAYHMFHMTRKESQWKEKEKKVKQQNKQKDKKFAVTFLC